MATLKSITIFIRSIFVSIVLTNCSGNEKLKDGGVHIGWAMEDISPGDSAILFGQYYDRIAKFVQSPLKVTALAIESTDEKGDKEQAIMVSADYWSEVRKYLHKKFSKDVYVLTQCGAAGDLSPRDLPRGYKAGDPNPTALLFLNRLLIK